VVEPPVAGYTYCKWGGLCQVNVYLLQVTDELSAWVEQHMRTRQWFTLDEAQALPMRESFKQMLAALPHLIRTTA
jgi:hypothetical protein